MHVHACEVEGFGCQGSIKRYQKYITLSIRIFMHCKNLPSAKSVEISTFVKICKWIFIEYTCINTLYTKYNRAFLPYFGNFRQSKKSLYIKAFPRFFVMFFWYIALYTIFIKKVTHAMLCMFMHKMRVLF